MPSSGEALRQELQKALENSSSLDDFVQIIRELSQLEQQHNLDSEAFLARFQRGEMGDNVDFVRWANKYEIYQEMKGDLEHVLDLLAQYALPVAA
jgi:hypothetical protein